MNPSMDVVVALTDGIEACLQSPECTDSVRGETHEQHESDPVRSK